MFTLAGIVAVSEDLWFAWENIGRFSPAWGLNLQGD